MKYFFTAVLVLALALQAQDKKEKNENSDIVSFSKDVMPVFTKKCMNCHNSEDESPSGLYMENYKRLMKGDSRHGPVVIPKKGSESVLVMKLLGTTEFGRQMPRGRKPLEDETIKMITRWIDQGAKNN